MPKHEAAKILGTGAALSAVAGAYKFSEFLMKAKRIRDVQPANASYHRTIQRVRRDLDEVQRLLMVRDIKENLRNNPKKARWVYDAIRDTRVSLETIEPLTERVAGDQEDGRWGIRHRFRWLLSEHEKLQNRTVELTAVHASICEVLGWLTALEPVEEHGRGEHRGEHRGHHDTKVDIEIERDSERYGGERDVRVEEREEWIERERGPRRVEEREEWIERERGPTRVEEREEWIERERGPTRVEERETWVERERGPRRVEEREEFVERERGPRRFEEREEFVERERGPKRFEERETYVERRERGPGRVEEREAYVERGPGGVEGRFIERDSRRGEEHELRIERDPRHVEAQYYERRPGHMEEQRYAEQRYRARRDPFEDREPERESFMQSAPTRIRERYVEREEPRYDFDRHRIVGDPGFGDEEVLNPQIVPPRTYEREVWIEEKQDFTRDQYGNKLPDRFLPPRYPRSRL